MNEFLIFYFRNVGKYVIFSFIKLPITILIVFFLIVNYYYGLNELWQLINVELGATPEEVVKLISVSINRWLGFGTSVFIFYSIFSLYLFERDYLMKARTQGIGEARG